MSTRPSPLCRIDRLQHGAIKLLPVATIRERVVTDGGPSDPHSPEEFFDGHNDALLIYERAISMLKTLGPFEVRVTKSQVGLRRRRAFAFLWMPGRWLPHPDAEVVLSIAVDRPIVSNRFKEVAHPAKDTWMHHLEVRSPDNLDDEVLSWLTAAWERAG